MSALAMEHRIHILSKTSKPALTASYASYRRPRLSFEDDLIRYPDSSFLTLSPSSFSSSPSFSVPPVPLYTSPLSSAAYRLRRWPRAASSPPTPLQCNDKRTTPAKSHSTSRSSHPRTPPPPSSYSPASSSPSSSLSSHPKTPFSPSFYSPSSSSTSSSSSSHHKTLSSPTSSFSSSSSSSHPKTPFSPSFYSPSSSSPSSSSPSSSSSSHPKTPSSSSSSSPSSPPSSSSAVLVTDADYIQTVFPPKIVNNQVDMDLAMFTQIAEITDCLFLSAAAAVRHDRIRQRMITHIINCTLDVPNFKAPDVECINIQVDDSSRAHLGIYFDRCADLIRHVSHKGGRVLIHCVAGISRSASLCIAYLMKYERMSLHQAYRHVKRKRSVIHPNVGFWRQLIDYEKRIFGTNSVRMVHSNMGMIPDVYAEEATHIAMTARSSRYR